jgi:hypothetical protein
MVLEKELEFKKEMTNSQGLFCPAPPFLGKKRSGKKKMRDQAFYRGYPQILCRRTTLLNRHGAGKNNFSDGDAAGKKGSAGAAPFSEFLPFF